MFSSSKRLTYSLYLKYFFKHLIDHLQPNLGGADYMRETSSKIRTLLYLSLESNRLLDI